MTDRPTTTLPMVALFVGGLIGCASGAVENESPATDGPIPARPDEAAVGGDPVVAVGWVEAMLGAGEFEAAAGALIDLPSESVTGKVLDDLEAAVAGLSRHELGVLAAVAAGRAGDRRSGLVLAELALRHGFVGDIGQARQYARRAMDAGVEGTPLEMASAVQRGDLSGLLPAAPVMGVLLPMSGSPSSREYARQFLEGVEVGVGLARRAGLAMELVVEDNLGTRSGSVRGASTLVSRGAVAILGPLADENMASVADVVPRDLALLSPTVRRLPEGRRGVYSMGVGDPGAGRILAETAARLGYAEAVVIHPRSEAQALEAGAFAETFGGQGGIVRKRLIYEPGTTTFGEQLLEVESLVPELLVVAAPQADVELLAPQIAFYGLDTLDIQVAGTGGWTTPSVLESVDVRHTNMVVAVSATLPGDANDPAIAFRAAYEEHFRRSLRTPVPALGFDLVRMALDAYGEGYRASRGLGEALDRLQRFEGATGTYSFFEGRLVREHFPVRIYNRELLSVNADPVPPPALQR